jgi:octopine oxidase subunit B
MTAREYEFAVIGGGLVGAAIGWGLARLGKKIALLDEGDVAWRASRGNFALVWVQGKGLGMPDYAAWTCRSADGWAELAAALAEETGLDVAFQRPGGFALCLSGAELEERADAMRRLHNQPGMIAYPYEVMDGARVRTMLPAAGPEVAGGVFSPLDGQCNSLRLLRALHAGLQRHTGTYLPQHVVERIAPAGEGFALETSGGEVRAGRIVLAAGNGNARLAPMVGLAAPVRPQRGQVIVTERAEPFLDHPVLSVRQTDEGTVMIGSSTEEVGFDDQVGTPVLAAIAARAVRMFPCLGCLNVVRTWAALRVMSPDGFPIYDQSPAHPGAFLATCHSGVTLAANHALALPPMLAAGLLGAELAVFTGKRFDVPAIG